MRPGSAGVVDDDEESAPHEIKVNNMGLRCTREGPPRRRLEKDGHKRNDMMANCTFLFLPRHDVMYAFFLARREVHQSIGNKTTAVVRRADSTMNGDDFVG
jgi:hypothetical protein